MALWKRKKRAKESEDKFQETEIKETPKETSVDTVSSVTTLEVSLTAKEQPTAQEQPKQAEFISEKMPEFERLEEAQEDMGSGVILFGKKISGFLGKGFWGTLSIAILPPLFVFAFGILIVVFMLVFPLLTVMLVASIPVVFVTLFIFLIAVPVLFPLLVLFLLITGKGRLLIGSEGKWFGIEMFGKSYSLK